MIENNSIVRIHYKRTGVNIYFDGAPKLKGAIRP